MNLDVYVVTDETVSGGRSHAEIARLATAGGADVIQLRDKGRSWQKKSPDSQIGPTIARIDLGMPT